MKNPACVLPSPHGCAERMAKLNHTLPHQKEDEEYHLLFGSRRGFDQLGHWA